MNTPEWIKYDGSEKQIEEILSSKNGFSYISDTGDKDIKVYLSPLTKTYLIGLLSDCKQYLINYAHPYADLIDIWRLSGCPVWVRCPAHKFEWDSSLGNVTVDYMKTEITNTPDWNIPGAGYSLTPFED